MFFFSFIFCDMLQSVHLSTGCEAVILRVSISGETQTKYELLPDNVFMLRGVQWKTRVVNGMVCSARLP